MMNMININHEDHLFRGVLTFPLEKLISYD